MTYANPPASSLTWNEQHFCFLKRAWVQKASQAGLRRHYIINIHFKLYSLSFFIICWDMRWLAVRTLIFDYQWGIKIWSIYNCGFHHFFTQWYSWNCVISHKSFSELESLHVLHHYAKFSSRDSSKYWTVNKSSQLELSSKNFPFPHMQISPSFPMMFVGT